MTKRRLAALIVAAVAALAAAAVPFGLKSPYQPIACHETVIRRPRSATDTPVFAGCLPTSARSATSTTPTPPEPQKRTTGQLGGIPDVSVPAILDRIAKCESGGAQFHADGSVISGRVNPDDRGKYQISRYWWGAKAAALGYDIETLEGNTAMALWIYRHEGTAPWNASRACWQPNP